jgi:hypothetical protein
MSVDSPEKPTAARRPNNLLERAGHVLDRGDHWFASSAGRVFGWAQRGSDHATQQTMAALAEAFGVKGGSKDDEAPPSQLGAAEPEPQLYRGPDTRSLDLLWADQIADGEATSEPASKVVDAGLTGLVPLLQALGRIVEQHAEQLYVSLAGDDRFWMLVDALHSLTTAQSPGEAEREPQRGQFAEDRDMKGAR